MRVVKLWCCQAHFLHTLLFTQGSVYRWYFAGGIGDIASDVFLGSLVFFCKQCRMILALCWSFGLAFGFF